MSARTVIRDTLERRRWGRIQQGLRGDLAKPLAVPDGDAVAILAALSEAGLAIVDIGELKKLQMCRARLAAVTAWLEENRAEVFRHGLWDAVNAADEAEAMRPTNGDA